jgi:hypothetical protein
MSNAGKSLQVRCGLMVAVLSLGGTLCLAQAIGGRGGPQPPFIPQGYNDHKNLEDQLGIKSLRPGKNGNGPQRGKGYEDALANDMMPTLPDVLKMKDGTKVTTREQWPARRAEILEDFVREVYGRIPKQTPGITWEISAPVPGNQGGIATVTRTLTGHVDNSAFPQITVNLRASFTVPADAPGPVPIIFEFGGIPGAGRRGFGGRGGRGGAGGNGAPATAPANRGPGAAAPLADDGLQFTAAPAGSGVPGWNARGSVRDAIANGWGYGYFDPNSVQADAGGNALRQGIIGLCNKGEPRKPEDWGALRAWQWGISSLIDYFQAHPDANVDPTKLAVEGVSRYGKAALVAEAFEPRVAVAFVASSGEGGAKLHRHDLGEAVENLAGGEYYWMGGNFIKYGASDIHGKPMTAADLPVDSHELIALCAPRPCLISYGIPSPHIPGGIGDPPWVDAHGSYMAGVLASPVYELLGEKGFGNPSLFYTDREKFYADPMPPLSTLVGGKLAWRQHEGGHDASPNFPTFFTWISRYIQSPAAAKKNQ